MPYKKNLNKDSIVVITGGFNGIGEQMVYNFAQNIKCKIVVIERTDNRLEEIKKKIEANGSSLYFIKADLQDKK